MINADGALSKTIMTYSRFKPLAVLTAVAAISLVGQWSFNERRLKGLRELLDATRPDAAQHATAKTSGTPSPTTLTHGEPVDWRSVESTDYREYIANMKAIGVPWETIKDIIFTDVNRLYAHKARALGPALHQPYWHADSVIAGNQETERRRKLDALEAERRAFLIELVGTESDDDARTRLAWHEPTAPQRDFLSPEKRERVDALSEYDLRRDKLLQHPGGILLKDGEVYGVASKHFDIALFCSGSERPELSGGLHPRFERVKVTALKPYRRNVKCLDVTPGHPPLDFTARLPVRHTPVPCVKSLDPRTLEGLRTTTRRTNAWTISRCALVGIRNGAWGWAVQRSVRTSC